MPHSKLIVPKAYRRQRRPCRHQAAAPAACRADEKLSLWLGRFMHVFHDVQRHPYQLYTMQLNDTGNNYCHRLPPDPM